MPPDLATSPVSSRAAQRLAPHFLPALGLSLVGCLTSVAPADRYAGIVGATVLEDGTIVVLPAPQHDAGDALEADASGPAELPDGGGSDGAAPTEQGPPPEGCDFRGRWLVSDRFVVAGMGIQQATLSWHYYEIDQQGTRLVVKRGLLCGRKTIPLGTLGVTVDFGSQLSSMLVRERDDGRSASVRKTAAGCELDFPKRYSVAGATTPYYLDPAIALPTIAEKAQGSDPGWEDWDGDGKPGVAARTRGFVNGTLHAATRSYNRWSGSTPPSSTDFKLAQDYGYKNSVLEIEGSELLSADGAVDPDASLHFVRFVKLTDTQAASPDESALCTEIRRLAPELAPDANR